MKSLDEYERAMATRDDGSTDWGFRLVAFRKKRRLSQKDIAELCGVSKWTVSKWESGQINPSPKMLIKLKRLIGIVDEQDGFNLVIRPYEMRITWSEYGLIRGADVQKLIEDIENYLRKDVINNDNDEGENESY